MASTYTYYPRALRHFKDFKNHLDSPKGKEIINGFTITNCNLKGDNIEITLNASKDLITATYYRFGFLKVISNQISDETTLKTIKEKLWSFATINSVVSAITFKNGVKSNGNSFSNEVNEKSDVIGFCNSIIEILDSIGDHNRTLFSKLEQTYKDSPYNDFLKCVQSDDFAFLSIYISRLNQILHDISEFKEMYSSNTTINKSDLDNAKAETEYLIKLLELTRSFFERRYTSTLHIKENRRTRTALFLSTIACITAICALFYNTMLKKTIDLENSQKQNQILSVPVTDTIKNKSVPILHDTIRSIDSMKSK